MVIKNGIVHDGLGNVKQLDICVVDGKIAKLGKNLVDKEYLDAKGINILPGFIDPVTCWGINGSSTEVKDSSEDNEELTNPVNPELETFYAFNGRAMTVQQLPAYGITVCAVVPTASNVFGGQMSLFYTDGLNPLMMCLKRNAGMVASVSKNIKLTYGQKQMAPMTKMDIFHIFESTLKKASKHMRNNEKTEAEGKWVIFQEVLEGKIPLCVYCDNSQDRELVMEILSNWPQIKIILCKGNNYCADEGYLSNSNVYVVYGFDGINLYPESILPDNQTLQYLYKKDVKFMMSGTGPASYGRENFLWSAIHMHRAISNGEDVIKMMTSIPAKALGIDEVTGSIEAGKNADLVFWSANPLETYQAQVLRTMVCGRTVYLKGDERRCYY